ncbi:MAG: 16S rRNA (uracil(1498)-N(3))-methyltransferase [Opitutales bacterium]
MNLLLFEKPADAACIPADDPKARHLREVLQLAPGDTCYVGCLNGPRGCARLIEDTPSGLRFDVAWQSQPPQPHPIDCILATPRPQTARRLLSELTTLGVRRLTFTPSERADPNYARSSLWSSAQWRRHCILGAEQAFHTAIPTVSHATSLQGALAQSAPNGPKCALDLYEAPVALVNSLHAPNPGKDATPPPLVTLALGPERGWGPTDRDALRQAGFDLVHLGARAIRTETAAIAAVTLTLQTLGLLQQPFDPATLPQPPASAS